MITLNEDSGPADARHWQIKEPWGGVLRLRLVNDAETFYSEQISIERTGAERFVIRVGQEVVYDNHACPI